MKKSVVYLLIVLSVSTLLPPRSSSSAIHQNKPNLSGTWVLDMSLLECDCDKNDLVYDNLALDISYHEPELKITRKITKKKQERSQEVIYYTDGRGEKNPDIESITGKPFIKSKTKWEGNTLVSKRVSFDLSKDTDIWELSPNGRTLIHSTLVSKGERLVWVTIKRVFKK